MNINHLFKSTTQYDVETPDLDKMNLRRTGEKDTLEWLLSPLKMSDFLAESWEKKPLHISRGQADYYSSLFSLENLDTLLGFSQTNKNVRMAHTQKNNSRVVEGGPNKTSICHFYDFYYLGQTVVIRDVHLRWEAIGKICNALSREIGCTVGTHLYATPEASQGFGIHWDDHDIFALQIEGEKEWCLYDSGPVVPRKNKYFREFKKQVIEDPGEPTEVVLLKAGDLLYFPRGVIHQARAQTKSSLHLTFGIYPQTWEDVLVKALDLGKSPALNKSLPPGFLANGTKADVVGNHLIDLLPSMLGDVDFQKISSHLSAEVMPTIEVLPDGHFTQLDQLGRITPDTQVEKRPGMVSVLVEEEDGASLVFPGNRHWESLEGRSFLDFIDEHDRFHVRDVMNLGTQGLQVVKSLMAKGLLRLVTT